MKTMIITLIAVSLLVLPQSLIKAGNDVTINQETNNSKPRIEEILQSQMTYPKIAVEERIEGDVNVTFKVNDKGEIIINSIITDEAILEKHILESLKNVVLFDYSNSKDTYQINFKFNLM